MAIKIDGGQTLLFIGDSITDCGRRGGERPLGNGYVKIFNDLMTIREPAKKLRIINKGIGGDKVTGLRNRWTDDVVVNRPDWLSIKIGINDLHSFLLNHNDKVSPELFSEAYDEILTRARGELQLKGIILIDPFYISVEKSRNTFRQDVLELLPKYIDVVHAMSQKHRTRLLKTHVLFQELLKHHESDVFCNEPVHPNPVGHLAIAEAVYTSLCE